MRSEPGFRRLVNFSDAVVAIAITLLILPLVDSASTIGSRGVGSFLDKHGASLLAFALSFAVIGRFWWGHHQMLEGVRSYNPVLVGGVFVWLFSIVFLPFPTALLAVAKSGRATNAIYVGTMVVTAASALVQQWAVVRWPELVEDPHRSIRTIDSALVLTVLMCVVFVLVVAVPALGLWPLVLLLFARPLEHGSARLRARSP